MPTFFDAVKMSLHKNIILSEKLKALRIVNGYKFRFYRTLVNDVQRWICCKKTCNAAIKYYANGAICSGAH